MRVPGLLIGAALLAGQTGPEPLRGHDPDVALGVGHVRPRDYPDRADHDWLARAVIHVSAEPEGPSFEAKNVAAAGLETGYETVSLIVLEARPDGWLRLSLGWARASALATASPPLEFEPWERLFQSTEISPLYFRRRIPHALRVASSESAALLARIPADPDGYGIEVIEFKGDWARIRLSVPSGYCGDPDPPRPQVQNGWVRWRDQVAGPWLWYYTRGC